MKIAWFCIPAHGHTNPTLGVVRALVQAGHEVDYFSFEAFREKIEGTGARFIGCDGSDFEMEDKGNADRVSKDVAFATELLVSSTLALDGMVSQWVKEHRPDVIVSDSVAYWGKLTAIKHGIPYISSTTTFAFNRHSAKYMQRGPGEAVKLLLSIPKVEKQLRRLRAAGYPVRNILDIIQNDNATPTIVYTSKYFQPCAESFSDKYHFIGPSMRPIVHPMTKTADRTVYVSMGTINQDREFYRNCIEALSTQGWQVILSMGTNPERFDKLPPKVEVYDTVDQMAALSIADAFITHCGMNSASEGLWYGVPLVLFPQTNEQDAVAKRAEELGAGTRLRSTAKQDILAAVARLITNPAYKSAAARVSESFRACGGVEEARAFIEQCAVNGDGHQ